MAGEIADKNSIEILSRSKRIETKVSKLMERLGFADEAGERPSWENGSVKVPTAEASLKAILDMIPSSWTDPDMVVRNHEVHFARLSKVMAPLVSSMLLTVRASSLTRCSV